MAGTRIPQFPLAVSLAGFEEIEIAVPTDDPVVPYVSRRTTTGAIAAGADPSINGAPYVITEPNGFVPNGRVITGTAGDISVTDNGAGSTVVLDLIATAVTPGMYGSAAFVPQITVDAKGRITSVSDVATPIGTVTSVGLAAPADFLVTSSPITSSGTLTLDWTTPPTGTGAVVRATAPTISSPTLVTPALGTAASGALSATTSIASGASTARTLAARAADWLNVKDFGAVGDNSADDTAAFTAAIAAAAGGDLYIPYTSTGYKLTAGITFGGSGKAKRIIGQAFVKLNFTGLGASDDAVTQLFDTLGGMTGVTIDMGNSTSVYTNRDAYRLRGGEWPTIDINVLNAGRDAFHYESGAAFEWLENMTLRLRAFNMGRDGLHLECADFNAIFANELLIEQIEVRQWKRNAIYAAVNTQTATYSAAKMSNVCVLKYNFDANRALVDLTSQDIVAFAANAGAPSGSLYDAWTFGNGTAENLTAAQTGYFLAPAVGATVRALNVGPVILYNIIATTNNPQYQVANFGSLTKPWWIFDTVTKQKRFSGTPDNDAAIAGEIGEVITSAVSFGSPVSLTNGVAANVTSIVLTPGDWDVSGFVGTVPGAGTTQSSFIAGISTTSVTLGATIAKFYASFTASQSVSSPVPQQRIQVGTGTTTTVYLVAQSGFAVSTNGAYGTIAARRAR